jgi:hypothetical protein
MDPIARKLVFLSHANPEDNEFTRWLGLRLAGQGYLVWSDLTKLVGGEDFWKDAEEAIRHGTAKFLYILSKSSNAKEGPLRELAIAQKVAKEHKLSDFVVPIRVDDLPHSDINIELTRLNAVDFHGRWAAGLTAVIEKLENDRVPRENNGRDIVRAWWHSHVDGGGITSNDPESYFSNWYPIKLPEKLFILNVGRGIVSSAQLHFPAVQFGNNVFTFASANDLSLSYARTSVVLTEVALDRDEPDVHKPIVDQRTRLNAIAALVASAWGRFLKERGTPTYELSGGRLCAYFTKDMFERSRVNFQHSNGYTGSRALAGEASSWNGRTQSAVTRHWHYGISADPRIGRQPMLRINGHVIFSDDGKNIWSSKPRLHSARRKQCKNWWNDEWLDRMLCATHWLAAGTPNIQMRVGSDAFIAVDKSPMCFTSPVSYKDDAANRFEDETDEEDVDEVSGTEEGAGA